jgi:hypothetical protein
LPLKALFVLLQVPVNILLGTLPLLIWWNWVLVDLAGVRRINLGQAFGLSIVLAVLLGPFLQANPSAGEKDKE